MKRLFLMMAAIAMMSVAAMAQESKDKVVTDPKVPPQKEMKSTDMLAQKAEWDKKVKDELKLTPDQSAKFDALNKEYNDKMNAVQQDASLTKDLQKEKKMTLKKEKEAKLLEIFTPEQQAAYKDLIEKRKKEMEANKPSGS